MHSFSVLDGFKVVEFAAVLAGPSVGMFLAELGAEVIKAEHPGTQGDVTRSWRLPSEKNTDTRSSYFNSVNWGKKSITLNLKEKSGYRKAEKLVSEADIVVISAKAGDAEKLGLGYSELSALNPKLIHASVNGFGPDDYRTAYDAVLQAESGFMHLNRPPGGEPQKMPVALIDVLAAHHLKELILAAVIYRMKTGKGCSIEVSLFEAAISSLANQAGAWLYAGADPEPLGTEHPHIYPYGCSFQAADRRGILLAVGNDAQFQTLCRLLGIPDIAERPEFAINQMRSANRESLRKTLYDAFVKIPDAAEFLKTLHQHRIPAGMVRRVSEAVTEYARSFAMHESGGLKGLPQLTGRINGKRISRPLSAPPGFSGEGNHQPKKTKTGSEP